MATKTIYVASDLMFAGLMNHGVTLFTGVPGSIFFTHFCITIVFQVKALPSNLIKTTIGIFRSKPRRYYFHALGTRMKLSMNKLNSPYIPYLESGDAPSNDTARCSCPLSL